MPTLLPRTRSVHVRDFDLRNQQRKLATLRADDEGFVRFHCLRCPREEKIRLDALRARFVPQAGLVDVLNALLPPDCPQAARDASGVRRCGFCYRDLAVLDERPPAAAS